MILGRGIVGVTDTGIVFTEKQIDMKKARAVALRFAGQYLDVVPVGRITALQHVDNAVYPMGCSPNYGSGKYETAKHCLMYGDNICRVRDVVNMSDGEKAAVLGYSQFNACKSIICWIFARFLNRFGWINDKCIEEWDNAWLSRGNEGRYPDLVLFAGSEDGRLGLFVPGMLKGVLPRAPFRVRVQSVDYWTRGGPKVVTWETTINGTGLFLVWFGRYVLPYRAYFSFPTDIKVKHGFSGSNAYIIG
jgi:hypothetical protein